MPTIDVRNKNMAVDIRGELEEFDWGKDAKWSHTKLIARSPFRDDETPSFFVRLEPHGDYPAGIWSDSGAYDQSWYKGDFIKLLSFLRHETRAETEDYLLDKYGPRDGKRTLVPPRIPREQRFQTLSNDIIEVLPSPYLSKRGISEEVQIHAGTGRGPYKGYVAIPWHLPDGRLGNVKYRATKGKMFFYEDDAWPIGKLMFGASTMGRKDNPIICEAEIDALSWRTAGFEAIATGHGAISDEQVDIILRLNYNRLIAGGDNDLVGKRFNKQIERVLGSHTQIGNLDWSVVDAKDPNEVLMKYGIEGLRKLAGTVRFAPRFKKIRR